MSNYMSKARTIFNAQHLVTVVCSCQKVMLKKVKYNHKVVTVHKSCFMRITQQIPNLCVIRSDIVIIHWHSIYALARHKNVLLKWQHKHADKLHLYAIKLRHLLTPKCFPRSAEAERWFSLSAWGTSSAEMLMKNTQTVTFVKSHSKWQN